MTDEYQAADLAGVLAALGVAHGDTLLVHSALFALGPMQGVAPAAIPGRICDALQTAVGPGGTLVVPASFDDYARHGTPYDCCRSPVDPAQGALGSFVVNQRGSVRTYCPMSALAAIGPRAADICHQWTGSAFGTHSAWERLYELDAKVLFLGVRPARAFTFVLYIQSRFGVPYLYNKLYTTPVSEDGRPIDLPITCAVRYLNPTYQIREDCQPYAARLAAAGLLREAPLGRGRAHLVPSLQRAFDEGTRLLQANLFGFLAERPRFVAGEIPTDGPTGAFVPDSVRFSVGGA